MLTRLPVEHIEMAPGDALFFHPNLLHRSDQNTSEHPRYTPLGIVADEAILEAGEAFLDSSRDASTRNLER